MILLIRFNQAIQLFQNFRTQPHGAGINGTHIAFVYGTFGFQPFNRLLMQELLHIAGIRLYINTVVFSGFSAPSPEEMALFADTVRPYVGRVAVRGG